MHRELYDTYVQILKDELLPAMGCTEPVAVAYAGALAREALGKLPERVEIVVSRNIVKNVKSVVVPNTGGLRGLEAAAAIGIVAGDPKGQLEVLSKVTEKQIEETKEYMNHASLRVIPLYPGIFRFRQRCRQNRGLSHQCGDGKEK